MRTLLLLLVLLLSGSLQAQTVDTRQRVRLTTSYGDIVIALSDSTPRHRDNFLRLVREHYYDSVLFHRVIPDFMIQTGDPNSKNAPRDSVLGDGDVNYVVPPERCLPYIFHRRGAVAAARLPDDVNPDQYSSGCQFYIVWGKRFAPAPLSKMQASLAEKGVEMTRSMADVYEVEGGTPHLDGGYTVFGEVIKGMDVVDCIQKVATNERDRPVEDVVILHAKVEQRSKAARK